YLGDTSDEYDTLLRQFLATGGGGAKTRAPAQDIFALLSRQQADRANLVRRDFSWIMQSRGMQAYCLECARNPYRPVSPAQTSGWWALLGQWVTSPEV
ncbi:MAG: hypothetical protein ACK5NN_14445, partial [Sphingomonadaceae bacterium]